MPFNANFCSLPRLCRPDVAVKTAVAAAIIEFLLDILSLTRLIATRLTCRTRRDMLLLRVLLPYFWSNDHGLALSGPDPVTSARWRLICRRRRRLPT